MGLFVRLKSLSVVESEFGELWNEESEEYTFDSVDCSKEMLELVDENVWYKVEYDEDGDIRPAMLFGSYPKELIIDTMED